MKLTHLSQQQSLKPYVDPNQSRLDLGCGHTQGKFPIPLRDYSTVFSYLAELTAHGKHGGSGGDPARVGTVATAAICNKTTASNTSLFNMSSSRNRKFLGPITVAERV